MLTLLRSQTHSPIKKLFHKLENSIQTYINYHKTHAMATHYSGMGDTSMENPEYQDVDSDNQEKLSRRKHHLTSTINSRNGVIETNCRR